MRIERIDDGAVARLRLDGELDFATAELLEDEAARALAGSPPPRLLVLDLEDLSFCDSSGIDALLVVRAAALDRGADLRVVHPHGIVHRTLTVTGLLTLLTGEEPPDVEEQPAVEEQPDIEAQPAGEVLRRAQSR